MSQTKPAYIYINYPNTAVIKNYLEVIGESLEQCGYKCEYIKQIDGSINKKDLIVFPIAHDAFRYYFKGYKNIGLWQQGATADESYMRHKSKLRYNMLNFFDCFVMKKSKFILFVSEYMCKHYEKLSKRSLSEKSYIMPCYNEQYDEKTIEKKDYTKRVFTYVGSLSVWQCFEQTVELYLQIEKYFPDASLKVLTFQVDEARKILEEKGVKNYEVKCVTPDKVNEEILETTYGFVVREDNVVNRVATPTKFSSYLAAGVLPIYSSCLRDFHVHAEEKSFAFALNPGDDFEKLVQYLNRDIDKDTIRREIEELFDTYYSTEGHIKNIVGLLNKCL